MPETEAERRKREDAERAERLRGGTANAEDGMGLQRALERHFEKTAPQQDGK